MTGFVITQLSLCDFRGFSGEKSWTLGPLTKITGHNYQGKSSIADAIAFALTGAPYFGGRPFASMVCLYSPFTLSHLTLAFLPPRWNA